MPETYGPAPAVEAPKPEAVNEAPQPSGLGPIPSPSEIKKRWLEGVDRRRDVDKEAWLNISFISGDHYVIYDEVTKKLQRIPPEQNKVRLKVNLIHPLWRHEVATMVDGRVVPEVLPSSDEDSDREAAVNANRILDSELRRLLFEDVVRTDLASWISAAGHAYIHPSWDKNEDDGDGAVTLDVVPHFELAVDPGTRSNLTEAKWVIHGRVLTKDQVFEKYGQNLPASDHVQPFNWVTLFQSGPLGKTDGGVLVLRMWCRPSRKYPKGFVVTTAGDRVVEEAKPFPYKHGELPFIDFPHTKIPGRYEGQAMLTHLIPLQKELNQARSRMAEIRGLMSAPKVLAPHGTLDVTEISNTPGEVIYYRPFGPLRPEWLTSIQPPQFLFQEVQQAYAEMQDVAGQHEVSRGQVPASGIPASGIIALQERDERKIAPTIRAMERGIARMGKQILSLVQQYWDIQKVIRVWSDETSEFSSYQFKGADVKNQLDVHVAPGSSLPRSKAQARQDYIRLWELRVITDSRHLLRAMDLPNAGAFFRALDIDARQARREHDKIFKNESVEAAPFHNHEIHTQEHNDFRKSEIFEEWDPQLKVALADHVAQHEDAQLQLQLQAQQEAASQQLTPPEPRSIPEAGTPQEILRGFRENLGATRAAEGVTPIASRGPAFPG